MLLVGLYTSRVVLNALGQDDFGIYGAVGGVVALFGILTGSLAGAISRFLAYEMGKEEQRLEGELKRVNGMLSNEKFVSKAPEAKIAEEKAKLEKYTKMMEQVKAQIANLSK